jgi:hypothetical protein
MDDFLHNLRTGKNKPFDRNRKQFDNNGYKNPDRQGPNDNRRKDAFQRTPPVDHFPAIKILLGDITEGQRRLADIYERRATAEERIASALERIASSFFDKNPVAPAAEPEKNIGPDTRIIPATVKPAFISQPVRQDVSSGIGNTEGAADAIKTGMGRESVLEMIGALRKEQMSFEKIARMLEAHGIPTFSGKGAWHSQTVSKLCHQFHPSLCS